MKKSFKVVETILFFILILSSLSFSQTQESEQITITTYYPSPYGVYKRLRLFPDLSSLGTCDANMEGEMAYDSSGTKHALKVCICDSDIPPTCDWQTAAGEGGVTGEGQTCKRTSFKYQGDFGDGDAICQDTAKGGFGDGWYFLKTTPQLEWLTQHFPESWTSGLQDGYVSPNAVPGWADRGGLQNCANWSSKNAMQHGALVIPIVTFPGPPTVYYYWWEVNTTVRCSVQNCLWCCNFE